MKNNEDTKYLTGHEWIGKKVMNLETKKVYNVEKVWKDYFDGYFLLALIKNNQSHGVLIIDNIDSTSEIISDAVNKTKKIYKLIE